MLHTSCYMLHVNNVPLEIHTLDYVFIETIISINYKIIFTTN